MSIPNLCHRIRELYTAFTTSPSPTPSPSSSHSRSRSRATSRSENSMLHRATPETYILSDLTFPRVIAFVKILHADFSSILAIQSHSKLGDELYRQFEHLVKLIEETKVAMEEEAKLAESQKVPEKKRVDLRRKVWGRRWTILEDLAKDIDDELMGREGREVEEALKRSQISS